MRGELQDLINAIQERDSLIDKRAEEKGKAWRDKNMLFASKAKAREDNKTRPEMAQTKRKRKRKLEDKAKPEDGERHQKTKAPVEKKRRDKKAHEDYARDEKVRQEKRLKKEGTKIRRRLLSLLH